MEGLSRRLFVGAIVASPAIALGRAADAFSPLSNLKLMTEDYPPFNYAMNGELRGISVDIMVELFKRTNCGLVRNDIELLPWARGYNLTLKKNGFALFSTTRTEARENLFKWVGPFAKTVIGLTARKDKHLTVNGTGDLRKLQIGVVKDDIGHQLLNQAKIADEQLDVVLTNDLNYKKLISGRIDAFAYETSVARWGLKSLGENTADYELIHELKRGELYLALNPQISDDAVAELQSAFDQMIEDGTHRQILDRYLGQS